MKKVLFSLTMLTVLLSGCVYDDSELFGIVDKNKIEEVGTPLNVTASISEGTSNLRSIIDLAAFPNPSSIGVFSLDGGGAVANTQYDFTTAWAAKTTPIYIMKTTATVFAYYPFATTNPATPTSAATIPVTVANEATFIGTGQTDYMWTGSAAVTKASPTASLTFKHALSKVSFVINKGTNFVGTGSLTSVSLTKGGLTGGTMNVSTGAITGASAAITFSGTATINNALGTTVTCTGLVAPVATIATTTLTLVIDGITYSGDLPVGTISAWAAGKNYKYTVTINAGSLSVGTPTITQWTDVDAGAVTY